MYRISVVITNYNYERYVRAAIESALALEWHDVEIVVVDDGSSDNSPTIITSYSDRVKVLLIENSTQRVAANRGFELTTGNVVIFLDSDDVLPKDLPAKVAKRWTKNISKMQFSMQRIDANGKSIGALFPKLRSEPTPEQIRYWTRRTSAYPTPPGSGNAYARSFLDQVLPAGPAIGSFLDSACLAAAPFLGDVVTASEVVVGYRRHGDNDSNLLIDPARFSREIRRARARWAFGQSSQRLGDSYLDELPLFRSRELLQLRVASARLTPSDDGLPGDDAARRLLDTLKSPFEPGPEGFVSRVRIAAWCLATLIAPDGIAARLIRLRYER